jgi:exoribonuclease-2
MMSGEQISPNSLVLYKRRPARVLAAGERLEIELEDGSKVRVRYKDVALLHPGPLHSLKDLKPISAEIEPAWELLQGGVHELAELAELLYGEFTPASAWTAWGWVEDGLYFRGEPHALHACTPEEVQRQKSARQARQEEGRLWADFLDRARRGTISPQADCERLRELEDLALGRRQDSRLLRELGHGERPEVAHNLLLQWGCWDQTVNPYPTRLGLPASPPDLLLPHLPEEPRLDLTGLQSFAIDDRYNQDPDDAISLESCESDAGGILVSARLWVHVADSAALIPPDSPADLEARQRAATLYLPEGPVPMLPAQAVTALGLGLNDVSPALSFGMEILGNGEIAPAEIRPSWVRVQRLSYEQAEERMQDAPFCDLERVALAYRRRRTAIGAQSIDLPEAMIRVVQGQVEIDPLLRLRSRDLVREAMLMAGELAARFAIERRIPFPFVIQAGVISPEASSLPPEPTGEEPLSRLFAMRRMMPRSQVSGNPAPHAGIGLPAYSRVTSPLRRYPDLLAHQQLRQHLRGLPPLSAQEMLERAGVAEAATGAVAQAEMLSRRHWTLVYLAQHPGWQGEGVLVEKRGSRGRIIIPDLAFETQVGLKGEVPLDSHIPLKLKGVNLAELEAYF